MSLSLVCDVSGLTIVRGIVAFQRYIEWQRLCQTLYSRTGTQSPTQHRGFVLLIPEGACLRKAIVGWETGRGSAWRFENLECAAYFPSVRVCVYVSYAAHVKTNQHHRPALSDETDESLWIGDLRTGGTRSRGYGQLQRRQRRRYTL